MTGVPTQRGIRWRPALGRAVMGQGRGKTSHRQGFHVEPQRASTTLRRLSAAASEFDEGSRDRGGDRHTEGAEGSTRPTFTRVRRLAV